MKQIMKKLDRYVQRLEVQDVALLKSCTCSLGVLVGVNISKKNKTAVSVGAAAVFASTFIPLAVKFIKAMTR